MLKMVLILVAFMDNAITTQKIEFTGPDASKMCWQAASDLTVVQQPVVGEVPRPRMIAGCIVLENAP